MTATVSYASPVNAWIHGEYRIARSAGGSRPLYRFRDRITDDGSSGFRAEPGRYHLYAGRFCPWSQRVAIQRALNGLEDAVSISYVNGLRDARGWAFRDPTGPDPVNGFTLLRQAYEATEPGFDGHVSVPGLWDRETGRIVSNDFATLGIDLATQFRKWARADTYPVALRRLDRMVANHEYLLGPTLTEADVRLWVTVVRYDAGPNAHGRIGPRLTAFPNLWAYARRLYRHPAFRDTTDFASFTAPLAGVPDWDE
jgi:putative glutathione S-transferase